MKGEPVVIATAGEGAHVTDEPVRMAHWSARYDWAEGKSTAHGARHCTPAKGRVRRAWEEGAEEAVVVELIDSTLDLDGGDGEGGTEHPTPRATAWVPHTVVLSEGPWLDARDDDAEGRVVVVVEAFGVDLDDCAELAESRTDALWVLVFLGEVRGGERHQPGCSRIKRPSPFSHFSTVSVAQSWWIGLKRAKGEAGDGGGEHGVDVRAWGARGAVVGDEDDRGLPNPLHIALRHPEELLVPPGCGVRGVGLEGGAVGVHLVTVIRVPATLVPAGREREVRELIGVHGKRGGGGMPYRVGCEEGRAVRRRFVLVVGVEAPDGRPDHADDP